MPRKDDDDDDEIPTWDCIRGISYERAIRAARPWLSGLYVSSSDDYHLWHAATGTDIGGDGAGALPLPGGPGAAVAVGKRNRRQNKLWTVLVNKFVQNEKVKTMLLALPDGDVAVPAGGARGIGRRAWLLLAAQGTSPIDDEYISRNLVIFATCDIASTVGYKIGSVAEFYRYLTNLVFLLPQADQPNDSKNCVKILECLGKEAPEALALEATREFKARHAERRFVGANVGDRDLPAAMLYFGDMWDHLVRKKENFGTCRRIETAEHICSSR